MWYMCVARAQLCAPISLRGDKLGEDVVSEEI